MNMSVPTQSEAPLRDVRVLVTRAARDAAVLRRRLEERGAIVVELPTIAIEPPGDPTPLDTALRQLERYDWLVFTSRNAVSAVWDRLALLDLSPAVPCRIAAVGPSTAHELEARGAGVSLTATEGTAGDLERILIATGVGGKRVLFPVGDLAQPNLAAGLRDAGADVQEVVAYRTTQPLETRREALDAVRRGHLDVIILASPSAARNLAVMLGADVRNLQYLDIVCIGPTTASAVRELGLEPAAEARERTVEGLVQAVTELHARKAPR